MSCQPYLQWWISPPANLLLKTDHLVSLLLFLLPSLALFNSSTSTLFSFVLYHRAVYLSFAVLPVLCSDFFPPLCPIFTIFFIILGALELSSKLNDSCLWPLQRNTSVLCPSHAVCFAVVGLLSSLLYLSAHVCSKPSSNCLLSIQYPSQVKRSPWAPISSKPISEIRAVCI